MSITQNLRKFAIIALLGGGAISLVRPSPNPVSCTPAKPKGGRYMEVQNH